MKKIFAVVLALLVVAGFSMTSFAKDTVRVKMRYEPVQTKIVIGKLFVKISYRIFGGFRCVFHISYVPFAI